MARVTVEDCLEKVRHVFSLVHLSAKRTKQLLQGAKPLVKSNNKEVVTSLREIADGKVRFKDELDKKINRIYDIKTKTYLDKI